MNGCSSE